MLIESPVIRSGSSGMTFEKIDPNKECHYWMMVLMEVLNKEALFLDIIKDDSARCYF